jgi:hypothetical protein
MHGIYHTTDSNFDFSTGNIVYKARTAVSRVADVFWDVQ